MTADARLTRAEAMDLLQTFPDEPPPPRRAEGGRREATADPPLQFESLAALLQRDIDAPRWLVPDLIPMAGVTYLAGQPKSGKSWLALFLAAAVAEGSEFLGRQLDVDGPALIVDAEVSPAMLQQRVRLVAAGHRIDNAALDRVHVHHGRLFLDREDQVAALKAAVMDVEPALVVLDPLAKLHAGRDENSASDMAWLSGCIRLVAALGPAVVVVHHTVKIGDGRRGGTLLRGSSALWADADGLLLVEREGSELVVQVDGRYCNGNQRIAATITVDSSHLVPFARLVTIGMPALNAARADSVLAILQQNPAGMTKTAVRERLGASGITVDHALTELQRQGLALMSRVNGKNVWRIVS